MHIGIERVLCAVDFSEFSRHALDDALAVAHWYDAELTVIHVVPLVPSSAVADPAVASVPIVHLEERDVADATAELRDFVGTAAAPSDRIKSAVLVGAVVPRILDQARECRADLLVVGTHGRSGFERFLLGSVSERVLRKAPCPVLTVPGQVERVPPDTVPFKRIVCAVDFSEASLGALEYALSLARASDGQMTVVHALEMIEEEPAVPSSFSVPEYRLVREREASNRLAQLVPADASDWCTLETVVVVGKAYRGVLSVAEERAADLIVIGVQGRNPIDVMFFGSTAQHVVRQATCPVLTVRPPSP